MLKFTIAAGDSYGKFTCSTLERWFAVAPYPSRDGSRKWGRRSVWAVGKTKEGRKICPEFTTAAWSSRSDLWGVACSVCKVISWGWTQPVSPLLLAWRRCFGRVWSPAAAPVPHLTWHLLSIVTIRSLMTVSEGYPPAHQTQARLMSFRSRGSQKSM